MRLFAAVFIFIAFSIACLFALFVVSFTGQQFFYAPFIVIVTLGLYVYILLALYNQFKKKIVKISLLSFLCLALVSLITYEGYKAYQESLKVVSVQDVDIYNYQPFAEGSLAASLDEESTFSIDNNLPRLDGSTALYPVYSAFVQAVYPARQYDFWDSEIISSQTSGAYERLINGDADIIFVPEPSDEYRKMAAEHGIELTITPIAKEAFIFFVNTGNPIQSLSSTQLRKIYSGEYVNWEDVGGEDKEILAFQRPENSGSQQALKRFMGELPIMEATKETVAAGMGMIIEQTASYKNYNNAIGYSFRFFSEEVVKNGSIRNLAVDDILPTKENIQNGTYPLIAQFYAITAGSDNPHIEEFIEWIRSEQGQLLVERTGYVPINK